MSRHSISGLRRFRWVFSVALLALAAGAMAQPSVLSINRLDGNPTSAASVSFQVTFDESVTGVDATDFAIDEFNIAGASVTGVAGSGTTYTVDVDTGAGDGTLSIDLIDDDTIVNGALEPLGGAGAGNGDFTAGQTYLVDKTFPTVTSILRADADPTTAASVEFTVNFSEAVSGVDATDFAIDTAALAGASVTGVTGSGDVYAVTVDTGTGTGYLSIDVVDDDTILDMVGRPLGDTGAGNGDFDGGESYTVDRTPPTVDAIMRDDANPTDAGTVHFTVLFSESVTGVDTSDFTVDAVGVVGASITGLSGTGDTYTITMNTGTGSGTLSVDVLDDDTIVDVVGQALDGPFDAGASYTVDRTAPAVISITLLDPAITNLAEVDFEVLFTEPVTGVDASDFVIDPGSTVGGTPAITGVTGTGDTYVVSASTGTGDGILSVDVTDDDTILDLLGRPLGDTGIGNGDFTAGEAYELDRTAPNCIGIVRAGATPTNGQSLDFTVTFDEPVVNVATTDFVTVNGGGVAGSSVTGVSGSGANWTVTVDSGAGDGTLTIDLSDVDNITDIATNPLGGTGAGNGDYPGDESYDIDKTPPVVTIDNPVVTNDNTPGLTGTVDDVTATIQVTVDVQTVAATNNLDGTWTLADDTLTALADNTYDVLVEATDPATNVGTDATTDELIVDTTPPTADSVVRADANPTNAVSVDFTVTFSEAVTGVDVTDFAINAGSTVGGAPAIAGVAGADDVWTVTVDSYAGDGTLGIDVLDDDTIVDQALNPLDGGYTTGEMYTIDVTPPNVTGVTRDDATPTNASSVDFSVTFDEAVVGVDATDFAIDAAGVAGASVTNVVEEAPDDYTVTVDTGTGDGTLSIDVLNDGSITDLATNGLAGPYAAGEVYDVDKTNPTVGMATLEPDPTNNSPIAVTVTFDEPVFGFTGGDVLVGNAALGNFVGVDGDAVYTFDLTPAADGSVTADIGAAVCQDEAGNDNDAAAQFSIVYDSTSPTVVITSGSTDPTNDNPIAVTVTFDEPVYGFDAGDLTLGNAAASNFTGGDGDSVFTFDATPGGDGLVTVDVNAAVCTDEAANDNEAATQYSLTYDGTPPDVVITTGLADPTNTSPIPVTVTFTEGVYGFIGLDVVVGNGTLSDFTGADGDTVYTFDVTPTADGAVTVDIAGAVCTDEAGNDNTAAAQYSITYDGTPPTPVITTGLADPTNTNPIPVSVDFGEPVYGFVAGDLTLGNAAAGNFTGVDGDSVFTFDATPAGDGLVTVDIAGAVCQDESGNDNESATQYSITYDGTPPSPVISSVLTDPTNTSPIPVSVDFGEPVYGFVVGDLTLGNAAASNFTGADGDSVFTFDATPAADGLVTVDIAGAVCADEATNDNNAAVQYSITYDSTPPQPVITTGLPDPTNTNPLPVTVTFLEGVYGFVDSDVAVSNGSISNFVGVDGDAVFTFDLTPTADGLVTVDIAGAVCTDEAGSDNLAAAQYSITYDGTPPSPVISTTLSDPANTSPIPVSIDFGEPVYGFGAGDLTLGNAASSNFTGVDGDSVFTFDATPAADGLVTVDLAGAVCTDEAGNANNAATQLSITYDSTPPDVVITTGLADPTNTSPIAVTVTFTEGVYGFVSGDLTLGNGSASNFAGVDGDAVFTFDLTPTADGLVTVDIAGAVCADEAANDNNAAVQYSITYDGTPPTPVITSVLPDPTNTSPIPVSVDFGEPVYGFDSGDLALGNAAASNFAGVDGDSVFTFDATPAADGLVTVDIAGAVCTDESGNDNNAATQFSITYDSTPPTPVITSASTDPTNDNPIAVTVTFDEPVYDFDAGDLTLGNAAASNFAGADGDSVFTFDATPAADGLVTVDIAGAVCTDEAANGNNAAAQYSITYDSTPPQPVITTGLADPTNSNPIAVTVTFLEGVYGFVDSDVTLGNGALSNFAGADGDAVFTFDLTPAGDGLVTVDIAAAVCTDEAGSDNLAAAQYSITYDGTPPDVVITTGLLDPTNDNPIPVTVTFTEPVYGFVEGDLVLGNAVSGNFTGADGDAVFTFEATPAGDGLVTVDIAGAVCTDESGNDNNAAAQYSITYDGTPPDVVITTGLADPTSDNPIAVTATFTEGVYNFIVTDIAVGNGSASNFAGADGDAVFTFDVTPAADGLVTVDIPGAVCMDEARNNNNAAVQYSVTYDGTPPLPVITTGLADPTNSNPIPVTVTFLEGVYGFVDTDVTVGNGAVSNFAGVDGDLVFTFDVTPAGDGPVTVDVLSAVCTDEAGNDNDAAVQYSITYDGTPPTPVITSTESDPTNASPIPMTVTFDEPVYGFAIGDLTIGNGAASNFAGADGDAVFTFDATPAGEGAVTADIAGAVCTDLATNGNNAAAQFSITYDITEPTLVIGAPSVALTNTGPVTFEITYTGADNVTLAPSDVTVNTEAGDAAAATVNVTGTGTVTRYVEVTDITGDGTLSITIGPDTASDTAGNMALAEGPSASFDVDNTLLVAIGAPDSLITTSGPVNFPVLYVGQDAITLSDVDVSLAATGTANAGTITVTGAGSSRTVTLSDITGDGTLAIEIAANTATDAAGNSAPAVGPSLSFLVDNTAELAIGNPVPAETNTGPVTFTVSYEAGSTITLNPLNVTVLTTGTATATGVIVNDFGMDQDVVLTGISGEGTLGILIAAGTSTDVLGNVALEAGPSTAVIVDNTLPVITVDTLVTNDTTPPLSGTVDTVDATIELVVDGQTVAATNNGDGTWTLADDTLTPLAEGVYDVEATATDAAGNDGTDTTTDELEIDLTPPTVALDTALTDPTNDNPIPVTATFSDPVYGLQGNEISSTTAVVTDFLGADGDTVFTFNLVPVDDGVISAQIEAGVCTDEAGNGNEASNVFSITYDAVGPVVTVDFLLTSDQSPQLGGTVNDVAATIDVTVDGNAYPAVNNGDGTLDAGGRHDCAAGRRRLRRADRSRRPGREYRR